MKKLTLMMILLVSPLTLAGGHKKISSEQMLEKMTKNLDLDATQQQQLKVIFEQQKDKKQKIAKAGTPQKYSIHAPR